MKQTIITLCLMTTAFLICSCGRNKVEDKKILRPVKYQKIGYLNGPKVRTFNGTSETDKTIVLSFRSSGVIAHFDLRVGQKVKQGQLLARLDNVQARLAYEQAITSQNSAESQLNTAKLSLNRSRTLYEKGSTALSEFEAAKNAFRTAMQSYESAKRGVAIQKEQIRFGHLYAPKDGIIASVNTEINENVSPGQPIATLNAGTAMEIKLGIPESVINHVDEGDTLNVSFSSLPDTVFKAIVSEVAPSISPNTATYPVTATLLENVATIKSGMSANVTFDFGADDATGGAIVVPANAVGEDQDGRFVFLIVEKENLTTVKKQPVKIGNLTSEGFKIISGLSAGQLIATAGLQNLIDGQQIKLK